MKNVQFPMLSEQERRERLNIPAGQIRLVIDTDAAVECDDQFNIAWALCSKDRFNVEAVYAAPFSLDCIGHLLGGEPEKLTGSTSYAQNPADGMEASYQEILKLFSLLKEDPTGRVFRGAKTYIKDLGCEVESEAAKDLVKRAMSSDEVLYVASTGVPTNIASALLMEPELVKKIVVIWLGGEPLYFGHGVDFNLMQDIEAVRVLFNSGVPLVMIPCMNVASLLTLTKAEAEQFLVGKNQICDYLSQLVMRTYGDDAAAAQMVGLLRHLYLTGREDRSDEYLMQFKNGPALWSRIICDISTTAFLKNPGWMLSTLESAPILNDDLTWGVDKSRHSIRVVNYCFRDLVYGDMLACLTSAN